jgi:hypothetical protein
MTQRIPRPNKKSRAPVIDINRYRRKIEATPANNHPLARRTALIQETADAHLKNPDAQPLALAMVVLRTDGRIASVTEAIEPEQARIFADELEAFAAKLRERAGIPPRSPRQRGICTLSTIASLLFMAATYINENALVDAALSLAAQLTAIALARSRR